MSHRRQYELQQLARELGFAQVVAIDDDLGVSGSGSKERPGFGRLLTADVRVRLAGCLHWKLHVWRATIATGITSLTCAIRWSSMEMESMIRVNLTIG